jgi:sec-independent protein translocase protein TatC
LEDLRRRLYRSVVLFVVVFVGSISSIGVVMKKVLTFVQIDQVTLAASSPFQLADIAMDFGFFVALMVCIPYLIYSFYVFAAPALTREEKKKLFKSIPICVTLFALGFSYGFYILYSALSILAAINVHIGIANFWNIGQFLSQMCITSALLGLVFEFPLLLTLCIRLGLLSAQSLKKGRRVAYLFIFLLTSLLPPTDGLSLLAMALPLVLLYEMTILLNNNKNHVWTRV